MNAREGANGALSRIHYLIHFLWTVFGRCMPILCSMDALPARSQHLFIVRLWSETAQPGYWRGSVEHVPSGQKLYFTSLGDLNDFITLRLAAPSQGVSHPKETS